MIKNPTPGKVSAINALVLTGCNVLILKVFNFEWSITLGASFVLFIISYISIRLFLDLFIYRKIKLVYKLIQDPLHVDQVHEGSKKKAQNLATPNDPISFVNNEVSTWLKKKNKEISRLKEQEAFRKEFLGNVSHELKTPIFNIQGYLETLLDGAIHDPEVNIKFIKKAAKSAERLNQLVNDLLSISQMETGKLKMNFESVSLLELCSEVIEALEITARQNKVSLLFKDGVEKEHRVKADKNMIRQVLVNLISNGINYGKEDGHVWVGLFDMDEHVLIEVSDDGEGIAPEHHARLFERFYRVERSRSRNLGGTGLGLSIVKHIIESHDSQISVKSTLGKGTTFAFTLEKYK